MSHHFPVESYHEWSKAPLDIKNLEDLIKDPRFFGLPMSETDFEQSHLLDQILGYEIERIESVLSCEHEDYYKTRLKEGESQRWFGLHPQTLQTPFSEILDFLLLLKKYQINKVIDLGAGYGRVGVVMQSIFPESTFVGHEIVPERVEEGNRVFKKLHLNKCHLVNEDVLKIEEFPQADLYFIYDFSEYEDVRKLLSLFSKKMYKDRFFVVARGEGIRSMIQLKYPEFWAAHGAIHSKKWSLYSSFTDLD
jgi:hypothetical protein